MSMQDKTTFNAEYLRYVEHNSALIRNTLDLMQCQPIFFIGSGIPKRYFNSPGWIELLKIVSKRVGIDDGEFNYMLQKCDGAAIPLGQLLQEHVFEWAWKKGKASFPSEYFQTEVHRSCFLKYIACKEIESLQPKKTQIAKLPLYSEIELFKATNPHAIITTNYDKLHGTTFRWL